MVPTVSQGNAGIQPCSQIVHRRKTPGSGHRNVERRHAGQEALCTSTSSYACAAMSGSANLESARPYSPNQRHCYCEEAEPEASFGARQYMEQPTHPWQRTGGTPTSNTCNTVSAVGRRAPPHTRPDIHHSHGLERRARRPCGRHTPNDVQTRHLRRIPPGSHLTELLCPHGHDHPSDQNIDHRSCGDMIQRPHKRSRHIGQRTECWRNDYGRRRQQQTAAQTTPGN